MIIRKTPQPSLVRPALSPGRSLVATDQRLSEVRVCDGPRSEVMVLYDIFNVEEPRRARFSEITALAERIEGYRVVVIEGLLGGKPRRSERDINGPYAVGVSLSHEDRSTPEVTTDRGYRVCRSSL